MIVFWFLNLFGFYYTKYNIVDHYSDFGDVIVSTWKQSANESDDSCRDFCGCLMLNMENYQRFKRRFDAHGLIAICQYLGSNEMDEMDEVDEVDEVDYEYEYDIDPDNKNVDKYELEKKWLREYYIKNHGPNETQDEMESAQFCINLANYLSKMDRNDETTQNVAFEKMEEKKNKDEGKIIGIKRDKTRKMTQEYNETYENKWENNEEDKIRVKRNEHKRDANNNEMKNKTGKMELKTKQRVEITKSEITKENSNGTVISSTVGTKEAKIDYFDRKGYLKNDETVFWWFCFVIDIVCCGVILVGNWFYTLIEEREEEEEEINNNNSNATMSQTSIHNGETWNSKNNRCRSKNTRARMIRNSEDAMYKVCLILTYCFVFVFSCFVFCFRFKTKSLEIFILFGLFILLLFANVLFFIFIFGFCWVLKQRVWKYLFYFNCVFICSGRNICVVLQKYRAK